MERIHLRLLGVALRRPTLLPGLVVAGWVFRARDWYRRPPFLPVPPASFLRWRMETAYGDPEAIPSPGELARYLRWAGRMRRRMR